MSNRIRFAVFFVSLCHPLFTRAQAANFPVIDGSDKDLNRETIELKNWAHFPDRLLPAHGQWPTDFEMISIDQIFGQVKFSTFAVEVTIGPSQKNAELAIEVPAIFSSYELLVNGERIGSKGKVGASPLQSSPEAGPAVYFFKSTKDTVQFILQVANFYPSPGGIKGLLRLGSAQLLRQQTGLIKIMDNILFFVLFLVGLISLCFYYIVFEHRNVFLFQSLFSWAWLLRSLFGYHYRILDWVDLPWAWLMRIEYWSMIFTTAFALLFIASLFPNDFKKNIKIGALAISGLFAISVFFFSPNTFIPQIRVYLGFSCIVLAYVFVVIAKAFVDERGGVTLMLLSMFMGSLAFGYAIVSYFGFFDMKMMVYDISFSILSVMLSVSVWARLSKMDRLSETSVLTMEHFFLEERE